MGLPASMTLAAMMFPIPSNRLIMRPQTTASARPVI